MLLLLKKKIISVRGTEPIHFRKRKHVDIKGLPIKLWRQNLPQAHNQSNHLIRPHAIWFSKYEKWIKMNQYMIKSKHCKWDQRLLRSYRSYSCTVWSELALDEWGFLGPCLSLNHIHRLSAAFVNILGDPNRSMIEHIFLKILLCSGTN